MLGGRAAEEIVYGTKTTGAESDIEQATNLARSMVTRWGMSDKLGMVQLAPRENPYLGGAGGYGGDEAVQRRNGAAIDRCRSAQDHQREPRGGQAPADARTASSSTRWREALLARETLDEQEILEVTGLPPAPALETGMLPVTHDGNGSAGRLS